MHEVLRAIAEPTRLEILRLTRRREVPAGQIAAHFDVTRPAVSQHLRVLVDAGLLNERRDGTKRFYRLRPEGLQELRRFLGDFWDASLLSLKGAAERQERRRPPRATRRSR